MERRRSSRIADLTEGIEEEIIEIPVKKVSKPQQKQKTYVLKSSSIQNKRARNAKKQIFEENGESNGEAPEKKPKTVAAKKKKNNEKENLPEPEPMDEDDPSAEISIAMPESEPQPQQQQPDKTDRPRRSVASRRISYISPTPGLSSSSPELSEDEKESENLKAKKMNGKRKIQRKKASSSEGSDSEFERISSREKKKDRRHVNTENVREGKSHTRKKPSEKKLARKTENFRKSKNVPKPSKNTRTGLRMALKSKPEQPWKKNLEHFERNRKLAACEKRMLEYLEVAAAYAKGKCEEVSYDECYKIHEEMKKAYIEGRKVMDAVEKREREEETGEKESSSEDEWEEMERFEPFISEKIEVTLGVEEDCAGKDWRVIYLRHEINKKIREVWENTHKVHLLCYMYHLNFVVKTALEDNLVPSLMLSHLPYTYLKYVGGSIPIDLMVKMVKWYGDAFRPLNGIISVTSIEEGLKEGQEARYPATSRLTSLIMTKCFETDLDRAVLLFSLLVGMECTARICVNVQAIARKWDKQQQEDLKKAMETFKEMSKSRSTSPKVEEVKEEEEKKDPKKKKGGQIKKTKKKNGEERNYWVEYWQPREKRWICVDPMNKTVDEPLKIHEDATAPITYVFAIDNKRGICEVSQRYAMDCVKQEFRRRRTDPNWIARTLRLPYFAANEEKRKLEKMQMHEELVLRPLPTTMSEFKNHPLYVLEKDLLKFEAIYPPPETQKPLGQIRGHNVYPRACVYTLQGEGCWLRLARSIKIGVKPYKIVKARTDPRIPVEKRVEKFVDVYGFWQTEPYRRPEVKNGRIPRNEYGNVYMFNENMCPIGCVHLKLPGLVYIGRKLNLECVPATVAFLFDGGWNHTVMDGAVVLEQDKDAFVKEWNRIEARRAEREEKKRVDRVYDNWKKLIKGMLRLNYVRKQFGVKNQKNENDEKPSTSKDSEETGSHVIDNSGSKKPLEGFSLDDFIKNKK